MIEAGTQDYRSPSSVLDVRHYSRMLPHGIDISPLLDQIDQSILDLNNYPLASGRYDNAGDYMDNAVCNFINLYTRREKYDDKSGVLKIYSGYKNATYQFDAVEFYREMKMDYEEMINMGGGYIGTVNDLQRIGYKEVDLAEADLCYSGLVLLSTVMELVHFATNLIPGLANKVQIKLDENSGETKTALFSTNSKARLSALNQLVAVMVDQANHQAPHIIERAQNITQRINDFIGIYQKHIDYVSELCREDTDEAEF